MLMKKGRIFLGLAAMAGLVAVPTSLEGATITVDGSTYSRLSDAVHAAQAQDDGPHVINVNVDSISLDVQTLINEPMTINGDADGNGVKCDILVDNGTGIRGSDNIGNPEKCYIEIQSLGAVVINDLKIHPNADGAASGGDLQRVDAIRMYRPEAATGAADYTLNRVFISGSDSSSNYIDLDQDADLYGLTGVRRWGWGGNNNGGNAVIQLTNAPSTATVFYNATLNNCHAGLGKSSAVNVAAEGGFITINGGLFGHVARDGIRITGTTVTLTGSVTDRIRVLRCPNERRENAHAIEIEADAYVPLMEYVDTAVVETGHNFKFNARAIVDVMRFCRAIGNLDNNSDNPTMVFSNLVQIGSIEDCTFVGDVPQLNPLQILNDFDGSVNLKDCIFTSLNQGLILDANLDTTGTVSFTHCALPTDGTVGESLITTGPVEVSGAGGTVSQSNTISVSPNYILTKAAYDWSDAQGSGNPANGAGNANVLRPSNAVYLTSASDGGALTGGAGPLASGIDAGTWMLME